MNESNSVLFWLLLIGVVVATYLMVRRRGRRRGSASPASAPAPQPAEADYLDSSHIGGPVFDDSVLEAAREKAARDAAVKP